MANDTTRFLEYSAMTPVAAFTGAGAPTLEASGMSAADAARLVADALAELGALEVMLGDDPANAAEFARMRSSLQALSSHIGSLPKGQPVPPALVQKIRSCTGQLGSCVADGQSETQQRIMHRRDLVIDQAEAQAEKKTMLERVGEAVSRPFTDASLRSDEARTAKSAQPPRSSTASVGAAFVAATMPTGDKMQAGVVKVVRHALGEERAQDAETLLTATRDGAANMTAGNIGAARQEGTVIARGVANNTGSQAMGRAVNGVLQTGATVASKFHSAAEIAEGGLEAIKRRDAQALADQAKEARDAAGRNIRGYISGVQARMGVNKLEKALDPHLDRLLRDTKVDWENQVATTGKGKGMGVFDYTPNGIISMSELITVLRNNNIGFDELDANNDKTISYGELTAQMLIIARENGATHASRLPKK